MTVQELYREYQAFADDAGQAFLPIARFLKLYWVCQIDWLKEQLEQPITEKSRAALRPFRKVWKGKGATIDLASIDPPLLGIRAVTADFDEIRMNMAVMPVDSDELAERQLDPFRRGTNEDPIYGEEDASLLTIFSQTAPVRVHIRYVRFPVPMTPEGAALLETDDSRIQILRRVVAEKDLADEKYNRYQLLAQGIIPRSEQAT